jgi:hypothetical protein
MRRFGLRRSLSFTRRRNQWGRHVHKPSRSPVGQRRREESLFKLPKPGFHAVGFLGNRDAFLHVGKVDGREGFKRVGHDPRAFLRTKGRNTLDMSRHARSRKYECVYLHAWETGSKVKAGVGRGVTFCNHQQPRTAQGGQPPAEGHFNATQTDQHAQAVALLSRRSAQGSGRGSRPGVGQAAGSLDQFPGKGAAFPQIAHKVTRVPVVPG